MVKRPMNKISFWGSSEVEILVYLSRLLKNLAYKVAVFDMSNVQLLRYYVTDDSTISIVTNYGVDYYFNISAEVKINKLLDETYDYVLINYGFNTDYSSKLIETDRFFLITDIYKHNVLKAESIIKYKRKYTSDFEVIRVYNDFVCRSKKELFFDKLIFNSQNIIGKYCIYKNVKTCREDITNQYRRKIHFTKISKEMKLFLFDFLYEYTGKGKKEISKVFRKTRKGG